MGILNWINDKAADALDATVGRPEFMKTASRPEDAIAETIVAVANSKTGQAVGNVAKAVNEEVVAPTVNAVNENVVKPTVKAVDETIVGTGVILKETGQAISKKVEQAEVAVGTAINTTVDKTVKVATDVKDATVKAVDDNIVKPTVKAVQDTKKAVDETIVGTGVVLQETGQAISKKVEQAEVAVGTAINTTVDKTVKVATDVKDATVKAVDDNIVKPTVKAVHDTKKAVDETIVGTGVVLKETGQAISKKVEQAEVAVGTVANNVLNPIEQSKTAEAIRGLPGAVAKDLADVKDATVKAVDDNIVKPTVKAVQDTKKAVDETIVGTGVILKETGQAISKKVEQAEVAVGTAINTTVDKTVKVATDVKDATVKAVDDNIVKPTVKAVQDTKKAVDETIVGTGVVLKETGQAISKKVEQAEVAVGTAINTTVDKTVKVATDVKDATVKAVDDNIVKPTVKAVQDTKKAVDETIVGTGVVLQETGQAISKKVEQAEVAVGTVANNVLNPIEQSKTAEAIRGLPGAVAKDLADVKDATVKAVDDNIVKPTVKAVQDTKKAVDETIVGTGVILKETGQAISKKVEQAEVAVGTAINTTVDKTVKVATDVKDATVKAVDDNIVKPTVKAVQDTKKAVDETIVGTGVVLKETGQAISKKVEQAEVAVGTAINTTVDKTVKVATDVKDATVKAVDDNIVKPTVKAVQDTKKAVDETIVGTGVVLQETGQAISKKVEQAEVAVGTVANNVLNPIEQSKTAEAIRNLSKAVAEDLTPATVKAAPVQEAVAVKAAPVQEAVPAKAAPVQEAVPAKAAPVQEAVPVKAAPVQEAVPVKAVPVQEAVPVKAAPVQDAAPAKQTPVEMKAAPKNPVEVAKEKGETNPSVDIKQTYDITSDGRGRTSEINPNMINSGDVFVSNASKAHDNLKVNANGKVYVNGEDAMRGSDNGRTINTSGGSLVVTFTEEQLQRAQIAKKGNTTEITLDGKHLSSEGKVVVAVTDNNNRITNQIDADRLATPTTEQSVGNRAAEVANCRAATTTPSQAGGGITIGTIKTVAGTSVEVKLGKDGKSWDVDKRLIGNGEGVMEYANKSNASIRIAVHDGHVTAPQTPNGNGQSQQASI